VATQIIGHCDGAFSAVQDAFATNFAERGEVGAAVTVIIDGHTVVELAGGWANDAATQQWQLDTLVNFYSLGKALLALLVLQLVDGGAVDLDQPIASLWPEFAAGGKEQATIRHALTHRAGVPAIREHLRNEDLWNWDRMTAALAATEPWYEPGSRLTYHTNTFGHLTGEIIRRVTGDMPGARLRSVVAPLDADVWWGLPKPSHARCADIIWAPVKPMPAAVDFDALSGDAQMNALAHFNPPGYSSAGVVNTEAWRAAQVPSTNGHGSATGVARVYAALLEQGRLLSTALLDEATRPQVTAFCPILGEETTFGLGFKPTTSRRPLGPNRHSFGHFGTGGALGFADPDAGVAFGYVMNHVIPRWQSTRNRALIDAVYACL
jgi:CubicO group peptidase (beta-lactamase class C family)